jgi:heterodisulfide reductase subunit A
MRAFGKGYEEFYERIREEGVNMLRGSTPKIEEKDGKLIVKSQDIEGKKRLTQEVDMVILAIGLTPQPENAELAKTLDIDLDADGWFNEVDASMDIMGTKNPNIFLAGTCQGPKDIPDTVAQASAAASRVLQSILKS